MVSDTPAVSSSMTKTLLDEFKRFYCKASLANLDAIDRVYTQDVEFRDPVHSIQGRLALRKYLRTLYSSSEDISFNYLEEKISENGASIVWQMQFRHRRLNGGKPVQVRGITLIKFTDRIYYHEDFYDLGAMLYQQIPGLGVLIRYLNRRLSA